MHAISRVMMVRVVTVHVFMVRVAIVRVISPLIMRRAIGSGLRVLRGRVIRIVAGRVSMGRVPLLGWFVHGRLDTSIGLVDKRFRNQRRHRSATPGSAIHCKSGDSPMPPTVGIVSA
jgi:hypothetical protein